VCIFCGAEFIPLQLFLSESLLLLLSWFLYQSVSKRAFFQPTYAGVLWPLVRYPTDSNADHSIFRTEALLYTYIQYIQGKTTRALNALSIRIFTTDKNGGAPQKIDHNNHYLHVNVLEREPYEQRRVTQRMRHCRARSLQHI